ncbi:MULTISPECIES: helix-turn-helix domain-containing protein [unclassified Streptococcus]|uniref:helix-turn-helix domain-containing protein n=1 Tax=unclassified Streptococcus TaxID=2608887 RepID=UPI001072286B|nr:MULTISPECIES: helix-turn-helix transcriptional regulator [unclassified Streptococcus]MBF0786984.1 helix-turn-helix transcriptional regulator [Streptococcus sp. 19428wC2_LYSM12]MCQ9211528.1 helix-turn-helix transcriptional regulator [Streptococcus sp. B01]MCQ9214844.1 helix-turn-helix transcriptional regulator [Streptococcus sp. O1]TFV06182.1 XRE family transcriptional regulator [Streptococcus sp. LYSM12]
MSQFSTQLKTMRLAKNLSQDALAEQLFISRQSISKWENGDATPDLENLVKLAEVLEVSLDKLLLGKEPEKVVFVKADRTDWQLLVDYWWLLFPLGGFLLWFLENLVTIFN